MVRTSCRFVSRDARQLIDSLAEVRYGLVFQHLGFTVTIEPCGCKGPDMQVSRKGVSALVEISRFGPVNPGPSAADGDLLVEYGNYDRDTTKALNKIAGKFRQLGGE